MNADWDNEFMDRIEDDPKSLIDISHKELMERGGAEAVEMMMWLGMRGALSPKVEKIHRNYYQPMLSGMGLTVMADAS